MHTQDSCAQLLESSEMRGVRADRRKFCIGANEKISIKCIKIVLTGNPAESGAESSGIWDE